MKNKNKSNDFNLDEELRSKIAANEEGDTLSDDHEDIKDFERDFQEPFKSEENSVIFDNSEFEKFYKIDSKIKKRKELINSDIILSVRNLKQYFKFGNGSKSYRLKAVSNVSFDIKSGECFGIVGESGCGKTTTGRSIINLYDITSGSIYYKGYRISCGDRWNRKEIKFIKIKTDKKIKSLKEEFIKNSKNLNKSSLEYNKLFLEYNEQVISLKEKCKKIVEREKNKIKQIKYDNKNRPRRLVNEIQMIFQDPLDSLDPRMTVEDIIQEGLIIQGYKNKDENHKKVVEILNKVGLLEEHSTRYPHEFSGGQRQRIGIARALIMNPKVLICDEPISALDVSIRAQIINLLNDLKKEYGLTIIFIAHDLSVVKYFCDRIAVMHFGKILELSESDKLFKNPIHPYTKALLSAIPKPDPKIEKIRERIIYNPSKFHNYDNDKPSLKEIEENHFVYCNEEEYNKYIQEIK